MLASALERMSLREIGPQLKFPSVGGQGRDIISTFAHFFLPPVAWTMPGVIRATRIYRKKKKRKEMLSSTRVDMKAFAERTRF